MVSVAPREHVHDRARVARAARVSVVAVRGHGHERESAGEGAAQRVGAPAAAFERDERGVQRCVFFGFVLSSGFVVRRSSFARRVSTRPRHARGLRFAVAAAACALMTKSLIVDYEHVL